MIDLYYWPTPNGHKITLFLEEAGLEYQIHPVDISAGDQFKPAFLGLSPNNRMPAIVDHAPDDGGEPVSMFESGAILLYLPSGGRSRPLRKRVPHFSCLCRIRAGRLMRNSRMPLKNPGPPWSWAAWTYEPVAW